MSKGIGEGKTRPDHSDIANDQLHKFLAIVTCIV
jgi:vacuolar-type H+-ATPase subunit B/Vma2